MKEISETFFPQLNKIAFRFAKEGVKNVSRQVLMKVWRRHCSFCRSSWKYESIVDIFITLTHRDDVHRMHFSTLITFFYCFPIKKYFSINLCPLLNFFLFSEKFEEETKNVKELETSIINTTQRWESTTTSYHLVEPFLGKRFPLAHQSFLIIFDSPTRARENQWWSGYYSYHLQNVLEISFAFFIIILTLLPLSLSDISFLLQC